jgi:hypothetical protein
MLGGEHGDSGLQARGQFHPATAHWRQPGGSIGWLRVEHHGPTRAVARERELVVECHPHGERGPQPITWVTNATPLAVTPGRWAFPGLEVLVDTDAELVDPARLEYAPARASPATAFTLSVTPTPARAAPPHRAGG